MSESMSMEEARQRTMKNAETIAAYRKLRITQHDLNAIIENQKLLFIESNTGKNLSNAIDQIEQALGVIKKATTDSIVLEILYEIDGEVRY